MDWIRGSPGSRQRECILERIPPMRPPTAKPPRSHHCQLSESVGSAIVAGEGALIARPLMRSFYGQVTVGSGGLWGHQYTRFSRGLNCHPSCSSDAGSPSCEGSEASWLALGFSRRKTTP